MFAIFDHNGKQFKVQKGDIIQLDNLGEKKNFEFEKVLVYFNESGETIIGTPYVKSVKVIGTVLKSIKDKKIIVFKKKRRHNYRRKIGHRQQTSIMKITDIKTLGKSAENTKKTFPNESDNIKNTKTD